MEGLAGEEGRVVAEEDAALFLQADFRERRGGGNLEGEGSFEAGEGEGGDFAEVGEGADRGAEPGARGGGARGRGGGRIRVKLTLEAFRHLGSVGARSAR